MKMDRKGIQGLSPRSTKSWACYFTFQSRISKIDQNYKIGDGEDYIVSVSLRFSDYYLGRQKCHMTVKSVSDSTADP